MNKYLLFTPGPVNVAASLRLAISKDDICHPEADFDRLLASIEQKQQSLFENRTRNRYRAVVITGSGSAANEAILSCGPACCATARGILGVIMGKLTRLWATKTKDDEWWSSFVTAPLGIALNYWAVERPAITPNRITAASFAVAIAATCCIFLGGVGWFVAAAALIQFSHVLDCMDGQMARYRKVSSPVGSYKAWQRGANIQANHKLSIPK